MFNDNVVHRFIRCLQLILGLFMGTKRQVAVNICSVEGNLAGILVSKVSPGIFVIKVK